MYFIDTIVDIAIQGLLSGIYDEENDITKESVDRLNKYMKETR